MGSIVVDRGAIKRPIHSPIPPLGVWHTNRCGYPVSSQHGAIPRDVGGRKDTSQLPSPPQGQGAEEQWAVDYRNAPSWVTRPLYFPRQFTLVLPSFGKPGTTRSKPTRTAGTSRSGSTNCGSSDCRRRTFAARGERLCRAGLGSVTHPVGAGLSTSDEKQAFGRYTLKQGD